MFLAGERHDELTKKLAGVLPRTCPMCGTGELEIGDVVFEMRSFAFGDLASGGPILPVVPAECPSCGYTVFFNAVTLGLVPLDEDGEVS
jgi:ribosomal protein S27AE